MLEIYLFNVLKAARSARERTGDFLDMEEPIPPEVKEKLREALAAATAICDHLESAYEPTYSDSGVGIVPREVSNG